MNKNLKNLVYAAVFGAIIFVLTTFIKVMIPFTTSGGYVHLGQAGVFIAGLLLSPAYAVAAAAIGSALADFYVGYPAWVPATIVIKAIMVLAVTYIADKDKNLTPKTVIALILSGLCMAFGYYFYEAAFLVKNFISTLPSLYALLGEAAVNIAVTLIAYPIIKIAMDKAKISLRD